MLNDTWCLRNLRVLTAIAEELARGSAPVDTEQLIDEIGLTRQDLTALRALDVEYLIMRCPSGSRTGAATLRLLGSAEVGAAMPGVFVSWSVGAWRPEYTCE